MSSLLSRRRLLGHAARGVLGASLGASLSLRALLAQPNPAGDLGGGFHVLGLGTTNVLAVTGLDGRRARRRGAGGPGGRRSPQRLAALPQAGKVHTLFNTHWHPEQTGSNESLGQAGATIVAQENTKQWLTTDVTWPWNDETVEPLPKVGATEQNVL